VTTEQGYDWRHGWVPLTMRAALQKTHGNHEAAAELLEEARQRRRRRREARGAVEFRPPIAAHGPRARWAHVDDDGLAAAMGTADDAELAELVGELERRDKAARKAEAARARRAAARHARDTAAGARFDELCADGVDPQAAYAQAYGVTEERVRRDEAIASLRGSGYTGKGFDELAGHAFRDHAEQSYWQAEAECRGTLLNKAGTAAAARGKLHPRSLFTGPETRARKYASEELLNYWQQNGRLTVDDFRASILGGSMRHTSTAAWS
jgi:hypothetical protein